MNPARLSNSILAVVPKEDVILFGFTILLVFCLLLIACFVIQYWRKRSISKSPYTGDPLWRASTLSYYSKEKVLRYLFTLHSYDNRLFEFEYAAFCRGTGRLFTNCVTWFDTVHVDWSFLQKRYPGHWISWGSLTEDQQRAIRSQHHSLEGFQTEFSSPTPSPRLIEKKYAFASPGPLYVDYETKVLLGWKVVPDTELEVLVLQKPKGVFEPQK